MDENGIKTCGPFRYRAKRPSFIRCPRCRRRLVPKTKNLEPGLEDGELVYGLPPHKIPKLKRKEHRRPHVPMSPRQTCPRAKVQR